MHHALRSSLAIAALVACVGCTTQDRRIYTTEQDKNLHTPSPWAPSTTEAAADATSSLGVPPPTEEGPGVDTPVVPIVPDAPSGPPSGPPSAPAQ